jgi:hypothetical protein
MKLLLAILVLVGTLAACDRQTNVQRGASNEGKAAQSAAGGSSNEGKAAGTAGR